MGGKREAEAQKWTDGQKDKQKDRWKDVEIVVEKRGTDKDSYCSK